MKVPRYSVLIFYLETPVRENKWVRTTSVVVIVNFFFKSVMTKKLNDSYYDATWQTHLKDTLRLKILRTWINIGVIVRFSFSQASLVFIFNLVLIKQFLPQFIYLSTSRYFVCLKVHLVPLRFCHNNR